MNIKTLISVLVLFSLVIVGNVLTGCTNDSGADTVSGTAHNTTDYAVDLKASATSPLLQDVLRPISENKTDRFILAVGTWTITARYHSDNSLIESDTLVIQKTDDSFTIIIYNASIYLSAS